MMIRPAASRWRVLGRMLASSGVLALTACAGTTVVLLPDRNNAVGAVAVETVGGKRVLDQAFHGLHAQAWLPPRPLDVDRAGVESRYAELLRAEPAPTRLFTLHFQTDKAVLTEASRALLPDILAAVRQRAPTEITVFGHADATGSGAHNMRLSAERAQAVADWLRRQDPLFDDIDVQYFGETRPAVKTPPGTPEPANRRAEIMIL